VWKKSLHSEFEETATIRMKHKERHSHRCTHSLGEQRSATSQGWLQTKARLQIWGKVEKGPSEKTYDEKQCWERNATHQSKGKVTGNHNELRKEGC